MDAYPQGLNGPLSEPGSSAEERTIGSNGPAHTPGNDKGETSFPVGTNGPAELTPDAGDSPGGGNSANGR